MTLVYISLFVVGFTILFLIVALYSFRKKADPSFQEINSINERMQREKEGIQLQMGKMKEKQATLKNDIDWKKSVFQFTQSELKKIPNSFRSSARKKQATFDRSM